VKKLFYKRKIRKIETNREKKNSGIEMQRKRYKERERETDSRKIERAERERAER